MKLLAAFAFGMIVGCVGVLLHIPTSACILMAIITGFIIGILDKD